MLFYVIFKFSWILIYDNHELIDFGNVLFIFKFIFLYTENQQDPQCSCVERRPKFLGILLDSKLAFWPHVKGLKETYQGIKLDTESNFSH